MGRVVKAKNSTNRNNNTRPLKKVAPWTDVAVTVLVGVVWGVTNSLLKRGASTASKGTLPQRALHLLKTPSYTVPLVLNLSASLVFAWALSSLDLSIVSPIANTVAMAVTAAFGYFFMAECNMNPTRLIAGLLLVAAGVGVTVISK